MVSENENSLHAGALTENVDIRLMATINTDMSHLTPEEKSRFRIGKNPKKGNEFYIIDHKLTIKIKNSNIKFRAISPAGRWRQGSADSEADTSEGDTSEADTSEADGTIERECELEIFSAFKPVSSVRG